MQEGGSQRRKMGEGDERGGGRFLRRRLGGKQKREMKEGRGFQPSGAQPATLVLRSTDLSAHPEEEERPRQRAVTAMSGMAEHWVKATVQSHECGQSLFTRTS